MDSESPGKHKGKKLILMDSVMNCALFLCILFTPLVLSGMGIGRDEKILKNREYRLPSPRPAFPTSVSSLAAFTWQWEDYWRDIFPFRSKVINIHADVRYGLLGANAPNSIFLDDGYIFGLEEIDCYRGKLTRTDHELDALFEILRRKREFFQKHGVAYYFVLAPNRVGFYRELFDGAFRLPEQHALKTAIEARMPASTKDWFIFPDETLHETMSRHPDRPLFFKRDNHWNHWGRVVAASAIIRFMQRDYPALPTFNPFSLPFLMAPEDESFWAYLRVLGADFDSFPAPMSVRISPEWDRQYEQLAAERNRSSLTLCYASDSYMEILSDRSPEIVSFDEVKWVGSAYAGFKSPDAGRRLLQEGADIVMESVFIDAIAGRHYWNYMKLNADWLAASP